MWYLGQLIIVAFVYYISSQLGLSIAFEATNACAVGPSTGLAIAVLAIYGKKLWPGIFLGAYAANLIALQNAGVDLPTAQLNSMIIAIGNSLEAIVVVWLGLKIRKNQWPLTTLQQTLVYISVLAFLAAPISSAFGSLSLQFFETNNGVDILQIFLVWWVGSFVGGLVVAPFLLSLYFKPVMTIHKSDMWQSFIVLSLGLLIYYFVLEFEVIISYPTVPGQILVLPIIFYCAYRMGFHGLQAALFLFSVVAVIGTQQNLMQRHYVGYNTSLIMLAWFLSALAVTCLFLSAIISAYFKSRKRMADFSNKYQALVEGFSDLVFLLDEDGNYIEVIANKETLLVSRADELKGNNIFNVMPKENAQEILEVIQKTLRKGPQLINYKLSVKAGLRHFEGRTSVFNIDRSGNERLVVWASRDITHLIEAEERKKELQEQLVQVQKMEAVAVTAGGVAHDLNNLLSSIVVYPDFIRSKLPQDTGLEQYLDRIKNAAQQAANIVQDLTVLSRKSNRESKTLSVQRLIYEFFNSSVVKILERDFPDIKLKMENYPEELFIYGSSTHILKILMNLVINAFEAINGSGTVTVKTSLSKDDRVVIEVSDNGMGMTHAVKQRIFEPFFTEKETSKSGMGLGLAVVWGIVQDHGGEISVKSEPGKGSVFKIKLPRTDRLEHSEYQIGGENGLAAIPAVRGARLLVVDDFGDQRELLEEILSDMGCQVSTASSGEEAYERLKSETFDLVLLDMMMGSGWDGLETFKRILKIQPEQKVVILTGHSEGERIQQAQQMGVLDVATKPINYQGIARLVERSVGFSH